VRIIEGWFGAAALGGLRVGVGAEEVKDQSDWRSLAAISIGNTFEWFDFILYGYFAGIIAQNFFPLASHAASLLITLAAFGVAFLTRPLGALILGHYGDRRGRKPALLVTFLMMVVGTAIIAFAPPYAVAGITGSVLIVGGRLLQGFSTGGEFGSATALLAEQNPHRRGFFTSLQCTGQALAAVAATATGFLATRMLNAEQLSSWGWRIPFLLGLSLAPVVLYIRLGVAESPEFQSIQSGRASVRRVFSDAWRDLVIAVGLVVVLTVTIYTLVFMPTFAVEKLGLPSSAGFLAALCTSMLQVIFVPISGALSDRWGQVTIGYVVTAAMLLTIYPLFVHMTNAPTLASLLTFQLVIGAFIAGYAGVLPALIADLFPTQIRAIGTSMSYSLAVSIFGGFAPLINSLLIEFTGAVVAPAYYLMISALVSLLALAAVTRRKK
jgi:MFS transporter, MHS family, proline/betaine transporter